METSGIGVSGFACYLPGYRVQLRDWCAWTGDTWDKVRNVVGESYRMRGPDENAYTMAATAVLRLRFSTTSTHDVSASSVPGRNRALTFPPGRSSSKAW